MGKEEIKRNYQHYYQEAELTEFPKDYKFYLVNTVDRFNKVMRYFEDKKSVGADLETNALDFTRARVVGCSMSAGNKIAFYFPFRHVVSPESNLPWELFGELVKYWKTVETRWYNFLYDGQVIENEGFSVEDFQIVEVMHKVFNADTNWKKIGLKWAARYFLGWDMMTFGEVTGANSDFSYVLPMEAVNYAAPDAIATYELDEYMTEELKEKSSFIMDLDNKVVLPFLRAHQVEQNIDVSILDRVVLEVIEQAPVLEREIFEMCGRVFKIGSPDQVADVLESMGIYTGAKGKKGKMRTGAEFLDKIDHPIAQKIVRYKQITTWENNYVKPLKRKIVKNEPIRLSYFLTGVPTGRTKAGKDKDQDIWFTPINIQAVVKPDKILRWAHYSGKEDTILGWEFLEEKVSEEDYQVEFPDPELNIRKAFAAPKGWLFCKFDYSGEELRIPANLAGETVWIDAFLNKEDLHSKVAKEVFGEVNSEVRAKAKVVNFCETENNFVKTERGLVRVRNLLEQDKIVDRYGNVMNYKMKVVKDQPCIELCLSNGIKSCYHKYHRLLVWNFILNKPEWKKVEDIRDDYLVSKVESKKEEGFDKKSYLCGLYLGDGISRSRGKQTKITISTEYEKEIKEALPEYRYERDHSGSDKVKYLCFDIDLGEWGNYKGKRIPDEVFESWSYCQRISLLAGLIDSDGTVKNGDSLCFLNTNLELINKVALLCNSLGISTSINKGIQPGITEDGVRRFKNKKGELYSMCYTLSLLGCQERDIPTKVPYKKERMRREKPYLGFPVNANLLEKEYKRLLKERGYDKKDKVLMRLDNLRRGKSALTHLSLGLLKEFVDFGLDESYRPVKVISKRECIEDIYAIEVPSHEYISSSLISHNSIIYGSTPHSFASKFNTSLQEAESFYANYKNKHRKLFAWIDAVQRQAARTGVTYTAFGRPRRLYHWFASTDPKVKSFARRSATNGIVQGTGADILRIAMVKYYKNILKKFPEVVKFRMTVHDEIDVQIRRDSLHLIDESVKLLTVKRKDWPVPLTVGVEIGTSWGDLVGFVKDENNRWVPERKG